LSLISYLLVQTGRDRLVLLPAALLLSRPLVREPTDPRLSFNERTPGIEGHMQPWLERTVDHVPDDDVDVRPFEHEDDFAGRKVDSVTVEAALLRLERWAFGEKLGRFRLAAVLQAGNDRDAAHDRLLPQTCCGSTM
jgi:hypothetical protein